MLVMLLGRVIDVKLEQARKAWLEMLVMLLGIDIDVRPEQDQKT